jgi:hypothetical protein
VTLSWNPQEDMTTGEGSPGYGLRSMYREAAPSAEGAVACFSANARSSAPGAPVLSLLSPDR